MEGLLEMNTKERERLKVLIRLESGSLTQRVAAQQLSITVRQVQRLVKAYRKEGERSLISSKRGKKSNNRIKDDHSDEIAKIIRENYPDFGPTFAQEKLKEIHKIEISISSVRNIMIKNEIWGARKLKQPKVHQRREPRACIGELLQMDGSYHDWFEGRAPKCCLIVLIDDATSRIMWLQFVEWESCFAYFEAIKGYIKTYGKPLSIYTDRLAVFETTRNTEKNYKNTQFHRATSSLGINLVLANSPQAKGRVERANGTLQDRLVKEMRLARISSMEEGNAFLSTYIAIHNKKFAKKPKSPINAHKPLESDVNLEKILCLHHTRKITKDLMVNFKGGTYQIREPVYKNRLGGQKVLVIEKRSGEIAMYHKEKLLKFKLYQELPKEEESKEGKIISIAEANFNYKSKKRNPGPHHPWRSWQIKRKAI
jgi:transposase